MDTSAMLTDLRQRVLAGYTVLLLRTYEEQRWEELLANLALEMERGLVTWSATAGPQPPLNSIQTLPGAVEFLSQVEQYPREHLFLLKDFHPYLKEPDVSRKLRDMLPLLASQKKTLLLISPVDFLPVELIKDVSVLVLPLPGASELREVLREALPILSQGGAPGLTPKNEDRLVHAVLGLTADEARRAYGKVFHGADEYSDELVPRIITEKRHLIQGSNLLEFFDLDDGIGDIGGLDGLKEWVLQRANAYSADAKSTGITNPRGVLLAGVQGCGKSLSARAIARIFGFPLIRLDIGALLQSARGQSEQNLRDVLRLVETIAPAVLWLEEIDKAFAGFDEEAGADATMSRLVGRFLTWLQEHTAPVFVVATANNVRSLPPEMLRRGRFDELFFVDLPNYYERQDIFKIHLSKRGWKPEKFDIPALSEVSEAYSGAEIESIVNSAVIEAHAQGRLPTQKDLEDSRERTVPLSVTMEDEIFHLREWARTRCRPATQEYRVMAVMDEEARKGEVIDYDRHERPRWMQLAEHGQFQAAMYAYIELRDHVSWTQLISEFAAYLETRGEYGLVLKSDTKVVMCMRISLKMADLISEYLEGRRFFLHPATLAEVPETDRPALPILEQLQVEKVNRPVWFPTKFRVVPPVGGSARLARVVRIKLGKQ